MKRSSSFGEPKPLPGQPGYKVSQTVILEKDAKEMENRLKMLQDRLTKQRLEDEAVPKPGGSRWTSARADKGSVLTYNRDLQEKYKKKVESNGGGDPALWVTSNKKSQRKQENKSSSGDKSVNEWTVHDVSKWLISLNFDEYEEIFIKNQIDGSILLELNDEDLDYLNIKILNHRKKLMKSIQLLKDKSQITLKSQSQINLSQSQPKIVTKESSIDKNVISSTYVTAEANTSVVNVPKAHWSQLEPISKNAVSSQSNNIFVNSADNDIYDEEAERLAFQQAVMDWRKSNEISKVNDNYTKVDSLWSNPLDDNDNISDNTENISKKSNIKIIREYIKPSIGNTNISLNDSDIESPSTHSISNKSDMLDENAEHQEFLKAVEEWRKGSSSNKSNKVSLESGTETLSIQAISSKAIVEKLSKEFNDDHEKYLQQINIEKLNLQLKMEEISKKLESEKLKHLEALKDDITNIESTLSHEEKDYSDDDLSEQSSNDNDHNDNIDTDPCVTSVSYVDVELIESTLGLIHDNTIENNYIVEEVDD